MMVSRLGSFLRSNVPTERIAYGFQAHCNHREKKHGENIKPFMCDECGKDFANKNDLKGHIDQSHSRKVCDHCGKSLLNRFFLKKHLVFDHGIKKGAFICDFCPRTVFFVETVYKKHLKEKHSE